MRNLILVAIVLGGVILLSNSCKKDQVQTSPFSGNCADTISFSTQIEPMMNQNCSTSGCHDVSSAGGYNLGGHANIAANATIILNVLRHENGLTPMPLGSAQLNDSLIQQFQCWVNQGLEDN